MKNIDTYPEETITSEQIQTIEPFAELEKSVYLALQTYSNVHRGSGYNSMVSTRLYEQARDIVLEHLGLSKTKYMVIFSTPRRAKILMAQINAGTYQCLSSQDIGLPLGVRALVVAKEALPKGVPFQTGGGNARLVSPDRVTWAHGADRFEPGTPAIINVIAFANALQMTKHTGNHAFHGWHNEKCSAMDILYGDSLQSYRGKELLSELRKTLIGRDVLVPTANGAKPFINFDNGASTPTFEPIWEAVRQTCHQTVQVHREITDEVRSICSKALRAPLTQYDVVFTSNTTESINLVAESLNLTRDSGKQPVILNTILEHNSNELPWRLIKGASMVQLDVNTEGFIDLTTLETTLSAYNHEGKHGYKRIRLVAVSGASNVLGVFNDLQAISRIAHQYGAHILVDAAQLVAHRKAEMEEWDIDYLAFSAHKVYAPFGTGVLLVRKGLLNFTPTEMELIHASGEENAGGIAALGKSLVILQRIGMDVICQEEQTLTAHALQSMSKIGGIKIYGLKDVNSPGFANKGGVIIFSFKRYMPNIIAKELSSRSGIGIRSGCHCAHMLIKRLLNVPHALQRFQHMLLFFFPKLSLPGVARISFGIENTREEVDVFVETLSQIGSRR